MLIRATIFPFPNGNVIDTTLGTADDAWHDRPVCHACLGGDRRAPFYATDGGVYCAAHLPADAEQKLTGLVSFGSYPFEGVVRRAIVEAAARPWLTIRDAQAKGVPPSAARVQGMYAQGYPDVQVEAVTPEYQQVVAWIDSLPEDCTDYEAALVLLRRTGAVFPEQFGLAASAHQAFLRAKADAEAKAKAKAEAEARLVGEWMGKPGPGMQDFPGLRCVGIVPLGPGEYGERFLIRFRGPKGQELVWFTGENGKFDPEPGNVYDVRAGVKEHAVFNGERQTILTRCKAMKPKEGEGDA